MNATEHLWWEINMGSDNGLVPSGTKPLPEPMLMQICVTLWRIYATRSQHYHPLAHGYHYIINDHPRHLNPHLVFLSAVPFPIIPSLVTLSTSPLSLSSRGCFSISRKMSNGKISSLEGMIALKFGRYLNSSAVEVPANFHSNRSISTRNLMALRDLTIRRLKQYWISPLLSSPLSQHLRLPCLHTKWRHPLLPSPLSIITTPPSPCVAAINTSRNTVMETSFIPLQDNHCYSRNSRYRQTMHSIMYTEARNTEHTRAAWKHKK